MSVYSDKKHTVHLVASQRVNKSTQFPVFRNFVAIYKMKKFTQFVGKKFVEKTHAIKKLLTFCFSGLVDVLSQATILPQNSPIPLCQLQTDLAQQFSRTE